MCGWKVVSKRRDEREIHVVEYSRHPSLFSFVPVAAVASVLECLELPANAILLGKQTTHLDRPPALLVPSNILPKSDARGLRLTLVSAFIEKPFSHARAAK